MYIVSGIVYNTCRNRVHAIIVLKEVLSSPKPLWLEKLCVQTLYSVRRDNGLKPELNRNISVHHS